jgi:hypothetical protein
MEKIEAARRALRTGLADLRERFAFERPHF